MTLYEETLEAISAHSMYRSPDLDEWIEKIDNILSILKEPTIGNDKVERLNLTRESLNIDTSYSVRCCECTNDMSIPIEILKAEDPVKKAEQFIIEKDYKEAQAELREIEIKLKIAQEKFEKIETIYKGVAK